MKRHALVGNTLHVVEVNDAGRMLSLESDNEGQASPAGQPHPASVQGSHGDRSVCSPARRAASTLGSSPGLPPP